MWFAIGLKLLNSYEHSTGLAPLMRVFYYKKYKIICVLLIFTTKGQFHKSWLHVVKHRYSFIHLHSMLRPTFEKLFTGAKVWRKAQKIGVGRQTVYENNVKTG